MDTTTSGTDESSQIESKSRTVHQPEIFKLIKDHNWEGVSARASSFPDETRRVVPADGYTALHLAVMDRATAGSDAKVDAIRALLVANSDAAVVKCSKYGYTPLAYACMVEDENPTLLYAESVVKLILKHKPESISCLSPDGLSPLDIHIMTFSKMKRYSNQPPQRRPKKGQKKAPSTAVLDALLGEENPNGLGKALEVLYECNAQSILEAVAFEEAHASSAKRKARRVARSDGSTVSSSPMVSSTSSALASWWVWEWTVFILKSDHLRKFMDKKPIPRFNVMHAAAQVRDCPLPFLMLSMRAYPSQVRTQDALGGNLPLHIIAGWEAGHDPTSVSRKSMALSALLAEYPEGTRIRNKVGKTPLSLALETGTPWNNGVRRLTHASNVTASDRSVA